MGLTLSEGPKIAHISADSALHEVSLSCTASLTTGDEVVAVAGQGQGQTFVSGQPAGEVQALIDSLPSPVQLQAQRKYEEVRAEATRLEAIQEDLTH